MRPCEHRGGTAARRAGRRPPERRRPCGTCLAALRLRSGDHDCGHAVPCGTPATMPHRRTRHQANRVVKVRCAGCQACLGLGSSWARPGYRWSVTGRPGRAVGAMLTGSQAEQDEIVRTFARVRSALHGVRVKTQRTAAEHERLRAGMWSRATRWLRGWRDAWLRRSGSGWPSWMPHSTHWMLPYPLRSTRTRDLPSRAALTPEVLALQVPGPAGCKASPPLVTDRGTVTCWSERS
jgi:hypothetical protein